MKLCNSFINEQRSMIYITLRYFLSRLKTTYFAVFTRRSLIRAFLPVSLRK